MSNRQGNERGQPGSDASSPFKRSRDPSPMTVRSAASPYVYPDNARYALTTPSYGVVPIRPGTYQATGKLTTQQHPSSHAIYSTMKNDRERDHYPHLQQHQVVPQARRRPNLLSDYHDRSRQQQQHIDYRNNIELHRSAADSYLSARHGSSDLAPHKKPRLALDPRARLESRPELTQPLTIETQDLSKADTGGYHPQVEAISPTGPNEEKPEMASIRTNKEDLLKNIKTLDTDITKMEAQISKLKSKESQLKQDVLQPVVKVSSPEPSALESRHQCVAQSIYMENRQKAERAQECLFKLNFQGAKLVMPLYNQPCDTAVYHENQHHFTIFKPTLINHFKKKREAKRIREKYLAEKYEQLMTAWLKKLDRLENNHKRRQKDAKTKEYFEKIFPELKKNREEKERFQRVNAGNRVTYARSDADMEQIMEGLHEQEEEDKKMRSYAVIPPMMLDRDQRRYYYVNNNGLIVDPMVEYKEKQALAMWTETEKEMFKEKYLQHPKDFPFIAQFLDRKTVQDCVQYYYLTKKNENYKQLLRKHVKKRRLKAPVLPPRDDVKQEEEELPVPIITPEEKLRIIEKEGRMLNDSLPMRELSFGLSSSLTDPEAEAAHLAENHLGIKRERDDVASDLNLEAEEDVKPDMNLKDVKMEEGLKDGKEIELSHDMNFEDNSGEPRGEGLKSSECGAPTPSATLPFSQSTSSAVATSMKSLGTESVNLITCAICNLSADATSCKYLNRTNCDLYNMEEEELDDNMKVCMNCQCKAPRKRYTCCPIPMCHTPKRRVKKLYPFPEEWEELSSDIKDPVVKDLQLTDQMNKACSNCYNRISKQLGVDPKTNEPRMAPVAESVDEIVETPRWTEQEMDVAKQGLKEHGRDWAAISALVATKSEAQCKNFYFNYKKKFGLETLVQEYRKSRQGRLEDRRTISTSESIASTVTAPSEDDQSADEDDSSDTVSAPSPTAPMETPEPVAAVANFSNAKTDYDSSATLSSDECPPLYLNERQKLMDSNRLMPASVGDLIHSAIEKNMAQDLSLPKKHPKPPAVPMPAQPSPMFDSSNIRMPPPQTQSHMPHDGSMMNMPPPAHSNHRFSEPDRRSPHLQLERMSASPGRGTPVSYASHTQRSLPKQPPPLINIRNSRPLKDAKGGSITAGTPINHPTANTGHSAALHSPRDLARFPNASLPSPRDTVRSPATPAHHSPRIPVGALHSPVGSISLGTPRPSSSTASQLANRQPAPVGSITRGTPVYDGQRTPLYDPGTNLLWRCDENIISGHETLPYPYMYSADAYNKSTLMENFRTAQQMQEVQRRATDVPLSTPQGLLYMPHHGNPAVTSPHHMPSREADSSWSSYPTHRGSPGTSTSRQGVIQRPPTSVIHPMEQRTTETSNLPDSTSSTNNSRWSTLVNVAAQASSLSVPSKPLSNEKETHSVWSASRQQHIMNPQRPSSQGSSWNAEFQHGRDPWQETRQPDTSVEHMRERPPESRTIDKRTLEARAHEAKMAKEAIRAQELVRAHEAARVAGKRKDQRLKQQEAVRMGESGKEGENALGKDGRMNIDNRAQDSKNSNDSRIDAACHSATEGGICTSVTSSGSSVLTAASLIDAIIIHQIHKPDSTSAPPKASKSTASKPLSASKDVKVESSKVGRISPYNHHKLVTQADSTNQIAAATTKTSKENDATPTSSSRAITLAEHIDAIITYDYNQKDQSSDQKNVPPTSSVTSGLKNFMQSSDEMSSTSSNRTMPTLSALSPQVSACSIINNSPTPVLSPRPNLSPHPVPSPHQPQSPRPLPSPHAISVSTQSVHSVQSSQFGATPTVSHPVQSTLNVVGNSTHSPYLTPPRSVHSPRPTQLASPGMTGRAPQPESSDSLKWKVKRAPEDVSPRGSSPRSLHQNTPSSLPLAPDEREIVKVSRVEQSENVSTVAANHQAITSLLATRAPPPDSSNMTEYVNSKIAQVMQGCESSASLPERKPLLQSQYDMLSDDES